MTISGEAEGCAQGVPVPVSGRSLASESAEQTLAMGRALAGELRAGDVVALVGPLGAGKTQFVKGIAEGLGLPQDAVTSPTFTLLHEYRASGTRLPLYHADLFRLDHEAEAVALGLDEYFDGDGVTVVEWAEKFAGLFPARTRWWVFVLDGARREIRLFAGTPPPCVGK